MKAKELLLFLTGSAYDGGEQSLLCGVFPKEYQEGKGMVALPERNLTDEEAKRKPERWYRSILEILIHAAECKANCATDAFGPPPEPLPPMGDSLDSVLKYLDAAHRYLVACLERLSEEELSRPLPGGGDSPAGTFFLYMAQHDIGHGSQIEVLRETG